MAKGKYQLQAPHYFPGDIYLDSGIVVGDDTPYPVEGPPSFNMVPLDPIAQAAWNEENKGKSKPDVPSAVLNPTGNNPAQGPRVQFGSVSSAGGVHGSRGLAEAPRQPVSVEMAKAMAVQAAMIPKEEMDLAIEQERAKQADAAALKAIETDRVAAAKAVKVEPAPAEPKPVPPPLPPQPAPRPAVKF